MKKFYILLCILGTVLPYWQFLAWIQENGIDVSLLINEIVSSRISTFAWLDVVISAIVLIGFILSEGREMRMKNIWLPILATFSVGVSLGLPLFLMMREVEKEKSV